MDGKEFQYLRQKLQKTQKQMAQLLGVSLKAVQSYEQGWRNIPSQVERQVLLFLAARFGIPDRKLYRSRGEGERRVNAVDIRNRFPYTPAPWCFIKVMDSCGNSPY